jgi:hypothetical protein
MERIVATESILEQYRVHDFVAWHANNELVLNPHFQRRSVWDPQARTLLIDSVLRRMPVPKIYMRTRIDVRTKRSIREVVDGQQRLRAILSFANNEFPLTRRAGEYAGKRYADLDDELQEQFLSYPLAVDSLVNASDTDVLEVFARLNSYTVTLVPAEKRHAKFQGDFKWAVHSAAKEWRVLWEDFEIVSGRDRLRMGDDSLMAEMFGIVLNGVTDGGASNIERLYASKEDSFPEEADVRRCVDDTLSWLTRELGGSIRNTPLRRGPQFLMLFAAAAAARNGIPRGQLRDEDVQRAPVEPEDVTDRLALMVEALESEEASPRFTRFVDASAGSTQRIATRSVRYSYYRWALTGLEVRPR